MSYQDSQTGTAGVDEELDVIDFEEIWADVAGATWMEEAQCARTDPEVFFSTNGSSAAAIAVCRSCPVIEQCLQFALASHQRNGIWGGTTSHARSLLLAEAEEKIA